MNEVQDVGTSNRIEEYLGKVADALGDNWLNQFLTVSRENMKTLNLYSVRDVNEYFGYKSAYDHMRKGIIPAFRLTDHGPWYTHGSVLEEIRRRATGPKTGEFIRRSWPRIVAKMDRGESW